MIGSPEKMDELIEMPFAGEVDSGGPRNHVLDGGSDPTWEWAVFGEGMAHCKV